MKKKTSIKQKSSNGIKPVVTCRVRCSWEEISSLENGLYKDFGHMKLYTDKLSPNKVEKILNDYLSEHGR